MGEYVSLSIGGYNYLTCKNSFGDLLLFFTEADRKVVVDWEDGEEFKRYCFYTSVDRAKRCLDMLGNTLKAAKEDFELDRASKIDFSKYIHDDDYEMELVEQYTFENWVEAVHKYALLLSNDKYDYEKKYYPHFEKVCSETQTIAEKIILKSLPFGDDFFGLEYDNINPWNIFRVILEAFEPETTIKLDYTNLFVGGWCDEFPTPEDYVTEKTIILTEGKYDAEVISKSMGILYPYMVKFYSFIDFAGYKVQGSTNFLTHYFKAFVASGIQNRVIALYDNDSAGLSELVDLEKVNIPDNFRAIHLPNVELAEDYPTLGPNGKENMNINGKACSIEMFLGQDVLEEAGEFVPIHWRGFVEKTQTYQGEVMRKSRIQEKFNEKMDKALKGEKINESQWKEMNELLNTIFNAFV